MASSCSIPFLAMSPPSHAQCAGRPLHHRSGGCKARGVPGLPSETFPVSVYWQVAPPALALEAICAPAPASLLPPRHLLQVTEQEGPLVVQMPATLSPLGGAETPLTRHRRQPDREGQSRSADLATAYPPGVPPGDAGPNDGRSTHREQVPARRREDGTLR